MQTTNASGGYVMRYVLDPETATDAIDPWEGSSGSDPWEGWTGLDPDGQRDGFIDG